MIQTNARLLPLVQQIVQQRITPLLDIYVFANVRIEVAIGALGGAERPVDVDAEQPVAA